MAVAGLDDAGFEVIEAASGEEALRLLQVGITLDALLTDIRLP
jgi:CheY-like chemotaxis protein